ncbi:MAG: selenium cofactor biosynthesis protein YqeC [Clostridia bacterium]
MTDKARSGAWGGETADDARGGDMADDARSGDMTDGARLGVRGGDWAAGARGEAMAGGALGDKMTLVEALGVLPGVTAVTGGGGKTSLLWLLGQSLSGAGKKVLLATTTHIFPPACPVLISPNARELADAFAQRSLLAAGTAPRDGRLGALANLEELAQCCDYVLVEADGARRLPLKCPASHEPVVPACARRAIVVAGMDGVGQRIEAVCHRPALYAQMCGKAETDVVTASDVARVLCAADGGRKGIACEIEYLLNKADSPERLRAARAIARLLPHAVVGATHCNAGERWRDGEPVLLPT